MAEKPRLASLSGVDGEHLSGFPERRWAFPRLVPLPKPDRLVVAGDLREQFWTIQLVDVRAMPETRAVRRRKEYEMLMVEAVLDGFRAEGAVSGFATGPSGGDAGHRGEAEWRQIIAEKEEQLQDLHHRVKNSLQMISSLLSLEARNVRDPQARRPLQDAQRRIQGLARLHERLYRVPPGPGAHQTELDGHLRDLCADLDRSIGARQQGVSIRVEAEPVSIAVGKLAPLSLLVSELVTNAVKHGPTTADDGAPSEVIVRLKRGAVQGWVELSVSDDGPGLPPDFSLSDPRADLGLRLVNSFARQLGGTLTAGGPGAQDVGGCRRGAQFSVSFPLAGEDASAVPASSRD